MKSYLTGSLFLILTAAGLRSQNSAAVFGTVVDPIGAVIAGTSLELKRLPDGPIMRATADQNGDYEFGGLAPGDFELSGARLGFRRYVAKLHLAKAGQHLKRIVKMKVDLSNERTIVREQGPIVGTESPGIARRNSPQSSFDQVVTIAKDAAA